MSWTMDEFNSINALGKKLRTVKIPDRKIDYEIHFVFEPDRPVVEYYTSSIDAAMGLAKRVYGDPKPTDTSPLSVELNLGLVTLLRVSCAEYKKATIEDVPRQILCSLIGFLISHHVKPYD